MNEIVKKNGVSWGVGLGVLYVLITTLVYAFTLYSSWWVGIGILVTFLALYVVLVARTKKQLNGIISFKEAFTVFFIAILISSVIRVAYDFTLYNFVDPAAKEVVKEETIKSTVSFMEKVGTPTSEVNKAIERIEQQDPYSISSQATGFAMGLCISSVLGLLLALIFKSRPQYKE